MVVSPNRDRIAHVPSDKTIFHPPHSREYLHPVQGMRGKATEAVKEALN